MTHFPDAGKDLAKVAYQSECCLSDIMLTHCVLLNMSLRLRLVTQNLKTDGNNSGNPEFTSEIGN